MKAGKKVELLAPAGSIEGFYGAIHAGADAVYLGGSRFGARAYADNFTEEELLHCIRYAHLLGRKIYLTVNTLVKESELQELYDYLLPYYKAGLDGVIVQDIGVFAYIREHFPHMELHVSTQMTLTGQYSASLLKEMGACRIVPARELSLKELKEIKHETGLEIEAFIHGAMCYCYSGQCLFSSILGGRSGNRGRCAQPCRLPYSVGINGKQTEVCHPLSLKDMCTIEHIPELIEAGIDSFKIEGRMKKPEYTAGVTAIYRKYIDAYYTSPQKAFQISKEDLQALSSLYIRSQRQDGYYYKRNGKEMVTLQSPAYSGTDEELLTKIHKEYIEQRPHIPITVHGSFITGKPAQVTFIMDSPSAGQFSQNIPFAENCHRDKILVTAEGDTVQTALKQPITRENVEKQLGKLGDSVFCTDYMEVEISSDAFYPLKQINELRRIAVQKLEEALLNQNGYAGSRRTIPVISQSDTELIGSCRNVHDKLQTSSDLIISLRTKEQLKGLIKAKDTCRISRVYLDGDLLFAESEEVAMLCRELSAKSEMIVSLPYILRSSDTLYLDKIYQCVQENPSLFNGFQIRSLEGLGFLLQKSYTGAIYSDAGVYIWNKAALKELTRVSKLKGFCMPYELKSAEQRCLYESVCKEEAPKCEKIIYGRIPMMLTANCVAKTTDSCQKLSTADTARCAELTDRYNKKFPVILNCMHCMNVIYNTVPLSLHGEMQKWVGKSDFRLDFTLEGEHDTAQIVGYFASLLSEAHMKNAGKKPPFPEYTTGHEKRGVL